MDAEKLPSFSFSGGRPDSTLRSTEVELTGARRWQGQGWSVALLAGLAASWARSVRTDSSTNPFVTPSVTRSNGKNDQAGPFLGAAAEASLGAGFAARASLVARAARTSRETAGSPFGSAVTSDQTFYLATTEVRLGAGFAPPGTRFSVDLYLPALTEPRRWVAAAAYRF